MSDRKTIKKKFNIHEIIRVDIESSFSEVIQQVMHQLAEFEVLNDWEGVSDIVIRDYDYAPKLEDAVVISDYYYYADGCLNIPPYQACVDLIKTPITIFCNKLILPINFIVHMALLRKKHSLIHSAGVVIDGKSYLFPAFGGIGKTALVAAVVNNGGKFYGDDMNIINDDDLFNYPIDFSVYPYHMKLLKLKDPRIEKMFNRTKLLNIITDQLERYDSRLLKFTRVAINTLKVPCVSIPPRHIFGEQCFAEHGKVNEVYYLTRTDTNSKKIEISPIAPKILAEITSNILFSEWHQSMHYLFVYSGLSSFSLTDIFSMTRSICERHFASRPCYRAEIPNSMSLYDYQTKLVEALDVNSAKAKKA
jgi:hypothetical protein